MTRLAGTTTLITGAASGIGRLMALEAGKRGSRLVLWDRDSTQLENVTSELEAAGTDVIGMTCELTDEKSIGECARRVLSDCGPIDILINNAGIVSGRPFLETSDKEIVRTFSVNTIAPMRIVRAFLPAMIERDRGHVVNISSAGGIVASARLADYCASKFALFGFDEALRIELRLLRSAVRTTVVCPFYINTGMFAGVKTRFSWLLPILDPGKVAQRVLNAIERDRRRLIMPWFVYAGWATRLLPVAVFDWLADFFGLSRSMDGFQGRNS